VLENWRQELCRPRGTLDLAMVRCLRLLAAEYLEKRRDAEKNGISFLTCCNTEGFSDVLDFSRKVVRKMGTEANSLVVLVLSLALDVVIRVALLDGPNSRGVVYTDHHCVKPKGRIRPIVHLQLRPGHYDLLCKPEDGTPAFHLASGSHLHKGTLSSDTSIEIEGAEAPRRSGICPGLSAPWDVPGVRKLQTGLRSAAAEALEFSEVGLVALRCELAEASQAGLAALAGMLRAARSSSAGPAQETLGTGGPTPQLTLEP